MVSANFAKEVTNKFALLELGQDLELKMDIWNMKASFRIIGMYCATCKPIVEKQLKNKNAVKRIDLDYMTDSVIVEFDQSLITKEEIKERLEDSGYKFVRTAM